MSLSLRPVMRRLIGVLLVGCAGLHLAIPLAALELRSSSHEGGLSVGAEQDLAGGFWVLPSWHTEEGLRAGDGRPVQPGSTGLQPRRIVPRVVRVVGERDESRLPRSRCSARRLLRMARSADDPPA